MSDVLIRGMEMPKNCAECVCSKTRHSSLGDIIDCTYIGTVGAKFKDTNNILNNRHPDCPLIEVPPHGDLIDRDELMVELMDSDLDHLQRDDWKEVIQIIDDAPTIVPAERSYT